MCAPFLLVTSAHSITKGPISCQAALALVEEGYEGGTHIPIRYFTMRGTGSCLGGHPGPYYLTLVLDGEEVFYLDFVGPFDHWWVDATLTLTSVGSGKRRTLRQFWSADDSISNYVFTIRPSRRIPGKIVSTLSIGAGVLRCNDLRVHLLEGHHCPAAYAAFTFVP